MSTVQLTLPDSIHRRLVEAATRDSVSVDQFVATALAEKLSALMTEDYLRQRAARGDRGRFEAALSKVPDVEPETGDRLP
jgi:hypothetical protein